MTLCCFPHDDCRSAFISPIRCNACRLFRNIFARLSRRQHLQVQLQLQTSLVARFRLSNFDAPDGEFKFRWRIFAELLGGLESLQSDENNASLENGWLTRGLLALSSAHECSQADDGFLIPSHHIAHPFTFHGATNHADTSRCSCGSYAWPRLFDCSG